MPRGIVALSAALALAGCGEKQEPPVDDLAPTATPVAENPPPETARALGDCTLPTAQKQGRTLRDVAVSGVGCRRAGDFLLRFARRPEALERRRASFDGWRCRSRGEEPGPALRWTCGRGGALIRFALEP